MDKSFEAMGLSRTMMNAISEKGFEEPTEIQHKIIPLILNSGKDLIGQAQTGTGKTAAFAIPLLELLNNHADYVQALILVPTRELAIQVAEEFNSLKGEKDLHIAPIYGGQSYDIQFRHLKKGVDIVIGTPGRVIDHLNRKSLAVEKISFVVLDEADEMLNMGFIDDIEDILARTGESRRTLLFSATFPERIEKLAKRFMKDREFVKTQKSGQTTQLTDQIYYEVNEHDKFEALCRIVDTTNEFFGLVFCRTKKDVDNITAKLQERDYDAEGLHGDISQKIREKILVKFRERKVNILVATDVAARGLDIEELTHVINFSLPQDAESYLHRIGRTGRAGKEGAAITFVTHDEFRKMKQIAGHTHTNIRRESIPQIAEVIRFKKEKMIAGIDVLLAAETGAEYYQIARELLSNNTAEEIIAKLVGQLFGRELDEANYREIGEARQPKRKGEDKREKTREEKRKEKKQDKKEKKKATRNDGGIRMFLALGKDDGLTPTDILKMIKKKADIDGPRIQGITINKTYSFFNTDEDAAKAILRNLNPKGKGKRPLVELAN
ncbi:MAG: DEAD/DEAH box helicase [Ignavibacteriaceae bacterium]|nr:DEAD/DEAH box helicase [Ignavibacteriaceae bacterium]